MTIVCCLSCGTKFTPAVARSVPSGLTLRHRECLDVIRRLTVDGVPPSYSQIAREMHLKSKSGVWRLVDSLVARGHLQRGYRLAHSLVIIEPEGVRHDAAA